MNRTTKILAALILSAIAADSYAMHSKMRAYEVYIQTAPTASSDNVIAPVNDDVTALTVQQAPVTVGSKILRVLYYDGSTEILTISATDDLGTAQIVCNGELVCNGGFSASNVVAGQLILNGGANGNVLMGSLGETPNSLVYLWPTATPSAGQVIRVGNVSGYTVTLEWHTP